MIMMRVSFIRQPLSVLCVVAAWDTLTHCLRPVLVPGLVDAASVTTAEDETTTMPQASASTPLIPTSFVATPATNANTSTAMFSSADNATAGAVSAATSFTPMATSVSESLMSTVDVGPNVYCDAGYEAIQSGGGVWLCERCDIGYFQPEQNALSPACSLHSNITCNRGSGLKHGDATTDNACVLCTNGFFQPDKDSADPCMPWTVYSCPSGFTWHAGTGSADAVCVEDIVTGSTNGGTTVAHNTTAVPGALNQTTNSVNITSRYVTTSSSKEATTTAVYSTAPPTTAGGCLDSCMSSTCDSLFAMYDVSCEVLESTMGCSCRGCQCPSQGDETTHISSPPSTVTSLPTTAPSYWHSTESTEWSSRTTSTSIITDTAPATTTRDQRSSPQTSQPITSGTNSSLVRTFGPDTTCNACQNDYTNYGSQCCDSAFKDYGVTCSRLEQHFHWDCAGCLCTGNTTMAPAEPSTQPRNTQACASDCFEDTCDWWLQSHGVACETLETTFQCSCSGCSCIPDSSQSTVALNSTNMVTPMPTTPLTTDVGTTNDWIHPNTCDDDCFGFSCDNLSLASNISCRMLTDLFHCGCRACPCYYADWAPGAPTTATAHISVQTSSALSASLPSGSSGSQQSIVRTTADIRLTTATTTTTHLLLTTHSIITDPPPFSIFDDLLSVEPTTWGAIGGAVSFLIVIVVVVTLVVLRRKREKRRTFVGPKVMAVSESKRDPTSIRSRSDSAATASASDLSENEERLHDPWPYIRETQSNILRKVSEVGPWSSPSRGGPSSALPGDVERAVGDDNDDSGDAQPQRESAPRRVVRREPGNADAGLASRTNDGQRPRRRLRRRRRLQFRRSQTEHVSDVDSIDKGPSHATVVTRSSTDRLGLDSDSEPDAIVHPTTRRWRQRAPRRGGGGTPRGPTGNRFAASFKTKKRPPHRRFSPIIASDSEEGAAELERVRRVGSGFAKDSFFEMESSCSEEASQHAQRLLELGPCAIADMQTGEELLPPTVDRELVLEWLRCTMKYRDCVSDAMRRRFTMLVAGNLRMWAQCWEMEDDPIFQELQEHAQSQLATAAALDRARNSYEFNSFKVLEQIQGYTVHDWYAHHITSQFQDGGVPPPPWPWSMENEYCCVFMLLYLGHAMKPTVQHLLRQLCDGRTANLRVICVQRYFAASMDVGLLHQAQTIAGLQNSASDCDDELSRPSSPLETQTSTSPDKYLSSQLDNILHCELNCRTTQDIVDTLASLTDLLGDPVKLFNGLHPRVISKASSDGDDAVDRRCIIAQFRFRPKNLSWEELFNDLAVIAEWKKFEDRCRSELPRQMYHVSDGSTDFLTKSRGYLESRDFSRQPAEFLLEIQICLSHFANHQLTSRALKTITSRYSCEIRVPSIVTCHLLISLFVLCSRSRVPAQLCVSTIALIDLEEEVEMLQVE